MSWQPEMGRENLVILVEICAICNVVAPDDFEDAVHWSDQFQPQEVCPIFDVGNVRFILNMSSAPGQEMPVRPQADSGKDCRCPLLHSCPAISIKDRFDGRSEGFKYRLSRNPVIDDKWAPSWANVKRCSSGESTPHRRR